MTLLFSSKSLFLCLTKATNTDHYQHVSEPCCNCHQHPLCFPATRSCPFSFMINFNKLSPRSAKWTFLGYSHTQKGYSCCDPIYLVFKFCWCQPSFHLTLLTPRTPPPSFSTSKNLETPTRSLQVNSPHRQPPPTTLDPANLPHPAVPGSSSSPTSDNALSPLTQVNGCASISSCLSPIVRTCYFSSLASISKSFKETLKYPEWKKAMNKNKSALISWKTLEFVLLL